MTSTTTSRDFFERMYQEKVDPWAFSSSAYELSRYSATLKALSPRRFQRSFEPGCSVGVLTQGLAGICDAVEAIDISAAAIDQAQQRCRALPHVNLHRGTLPQDLPDGTFDLIVLSEIGYYFELPMLHQLARELVGRLRTGGVLLAVHWLGWSEDHVLSGDQVHATLFELEGLQHEYSERHEQVTEAQAGFRLDRWTKA